MNVAAILKGKGRAVATAKPEATLQAITEKLASKKIGAIVIVGANGKLDGINGNNVTDNRFWYAKAGLRERWTPLGHTVLYGEYKDSENDATVFGVRTFQLSGDVNDLTIGTSEVQMWGLGVVQEIDAAAMSLWISYRHLEGDGDFNGAAANGGFDYEDFQYVKAGALINF